MKKQQIGTKFQIHCYKHDGKIHRSWDEAILLDVKEDYLVFGNDRVRVMEEDGNVWYTREPAIMFFYNNSWYNIIAQLKENGLFFYCNIATPYLIEGKYIKYIDYDLDLRVFPDKTYKVLDESEYAFHKEKMKYSDEIDVIVHSELEKLIEKMSKSEKELSETSINEYYKKYLRIKKTTATGPK